MKVAAVDMIHSIDALASHYWDLERVATEMQARVTDWRMLNEDV